MRILQVVTLMSPRGEYGGPTRVATNQAHALRSLGHSVTIAGGFWRRKGQNTEVYSDPPHVRLFPVRRVIPRVGFAGLAAPGLTKYVVAHGKDYDVIHVHLARDMVTLPAAKLAQVRGVPVISQTHGMIDPSHNWLAKPLDRFVTKPVLRNSNSVCYLTPKEGRGLVEVCGEGLNLKQVVNGVPTSNLRQERTAGHQTEVLYLARLAERKRPLAFTDAAREILPTHDGARFTLVGPDEGQGTAVNQFISSHGLTGRVSWEGALAPHLTLERIAKSDLYVLPSFDEPFPMSVLEAMSVAVPVIVTDTCGLADQVRDSGGGIVVDNDLSNLTNAIDALLRDPGRRDAMGSAGQHWARTHFSMSSVALKLVDIYQDAISHRRSLTLRS